ncbi:hypothetical protein ABK040_006893 [Willaertia magna]
MQNLPEDLILSICFFIETKDLPSILLFNRHWIDVSKYEVLWKFHYTNFLYNKSIQNEKNNKKKSYYRTRYKSEIDETLNLFERQKYLEKKKNSEELSSNLFVGDRYYTIFKKEVYGSMITKYKNYLNKFFDIKLILQPKQEITHFLGFKDFIENSIFFTKWKDTLQFLNTKITKPFCGDSRIDQYNFIYLKSDLFINTLLSDFNKLNKLAIKYLQNEDLKLSKEYIKKIISFIILLFTSSEPIIDIKEQIFNETSLKWVKTSPFKELIDMKPFSYPIDLGLHFKTLLDIQDISLINYLLSEMERDLNSNENKRFLSFNNLNYKLPEINNTKKKSKDYDKTLNVFTFCYDLFVNSIRYEYSLHEIDRFLTFINNNFKELNINENIPKELFNNNDNQMNSKLCYFLYNQTISDKRSILDSIFVYGYDLTEKAILEWKLTHETFFLEIMGFYRNIYSGRSFTITDEQALELFKLYKEVNPTCQLVIQYLKLFSKKLSLRTAQYLIKELANNLMIENSVTDEKEATEMIVNHLDDEYGLPALFLQCHYMSNLWEENQLNESFNIIEYLIDCGAIPVCDNVNEETILPVEAFICSMCSIPFQEQTEDTISLEEKKDMVLLPYEDLIYRMVALGADPGKNCNGRRNPVFILASSSVSFTMKSRMIKKFVLEYEIDYNPVIDSYGTTLLDCYFWDTRSKTGGSITGQDLLEAIGIIKN